MNHSHPTSSSSSSSPSQSEDAAAASSIVPSAIPAAEPVERGRFVLQLHDRIDDDDDDDDDDSSRPDVTTTPDSPRSFDADDVFANVLIDDVDNDDRRAALDVDIERLMGGDVVVDAQSSSTHSRRTRHGSRDGHDGAAVLELEFDADRHRRRGSRLTCCCRRATATATASTRRVGNMMIIFPKCYNSIGLGIIGPHWFGPICCLILLTASTYILVPRASNIGPLSSLGCVVFCVLSVTSLFVVSCTDPGVVRPGGLDVDGGGRHCYAGVPNSNMTAGGGWRFCDLCSVYQPPNAVHCPECNVCIEGYDHHCPWMGTCIGGKNFTAFMVFNLTWLFYLVYAILWVAVIGPKFWVRP